MPYPENANGDVFRRLEQNRFDFSKPHDVEFFALFPTEAAADLVAKMYVLEHKSGNRLANIETKPASTGGMQLTLVKSMYVTYENVTSFEETLLKRASGVGGKVDGWGVMQED